MITVILWKFGIHYCSFHGTVFSIASESLLSWENHIWPHYWCFSGFKMPKVQNLELGM
jgi:hypothetical protein